MRHRFERAFSRLLKTTVDCTSVCLVDSYIEDCLTTSRAPTLFDEFLKSLQIYPGRAKTPLPMLLLHFPQDPEGRTLIAA